MTSPEGVLLGKIEQDWSCGRCFELFLCPGGYSYYAVSGPAGDVQFYIRHKCAPPSHSPLRTSPAVVSSAPGRSAAAHTDAPPLRWVADLPPSATAA